MAGNNQAVNTGIASVRAQEPTREQLLAKIAELEAAALVASTGKLTLKVSEKGAVSVYGLMRFPVTLYRKGWLRLLDESESIRAFIQANENKLSTGKDDTRFNQAAKEAVTGSNAQQSASGSGVPSAVAPNAATPAANVAA